MEKRQFAASTIGLPFQHTLTHVSPVIEKRPEGALDPAVDRRRKYLVEKGHGVLIGLESDKTPIATVVITDLKLRWTGT